MSSPTPSTPLDRQEPHFQPAKEGEFSTGADTWRLLGPRVVLLSSL